jgi:hypothetical protein
VGMREPQGRRRGTSCKLWELGTPGVLEGVLTYA